MTPSEIQQQIARFMSQTFLFEFAHEVTSETDLFDSGLIDSFGFVQLVEFVEREFSVKLSDDDLASSETATLSGITRLVVASQTHGGSAK